MFNRAPRQATADEVLDSWRHWSGKRPADGLGGDDGEAVIVTDVLWPRAGRHLVMPYVVEATVITKGGVTTYNLHLFIRRGRKFQYEHDHLWGMTSVENPRHMQLNDLLVPESTKRDRGRGSALLEALEILCRRRAIRWIEGGISGVDDMQRLEDFYRRRGYSVLKAMPSGPFEWTLLKEIDSSG